MIDRKVSEKLNTLFWFLTFQFRFDRLEITQELVVLPTGAETIRCAVQRQAADVHQPKAVEYRSIYGWQRLPVSIHALGATVQQAADGFLPPLEFVKVAGECPCDRLAGTPSQGMPVTDLSVMGRLA